MSAVIGIVVKYVLPLTLVIFAFQVHWLLGLLALIVFGLFALINARTRLYGFMGNLKFQQGQVEESMKWLEKAANRPDCKLPILIVYSFLLLKYGETEKAERLLERAKPMPKSRPMQMNYDINCAMLLWKKGKVDEAVAEFERLNAEFRNSNIMGSLGYMYIVKGDLDKALEFNRQAYEYNNTNATIVDNLGQTLLLRGEYEEALRVYEELMKLDPKFPDCHYHHGLVLEALDRKEEALAKIREALNYNLSRLSALTREDIEQAEQRLAAQVEGHQPQFGGNYKKTSSGVEE